MSNTSAVEAALRRLAVEKAGELGEAFVERARAEAPHATGALAASIHAEPTVETATGASVRVVADAPHAIYVERGRGPERAEPGEVIAFRSSGGMVIVTGVKGVAPDPFWQRTIDAWPDIVREAQG